MINWKDIKPVKGVSEPTTKIVTTNVRPPGVAFNMTQQITLVGAQTSVSMPFPAAGTTFQLPYPCLLKEICIGAFGIVGGNFIVINNNVIILQMTDGLFAASDRNPGFDPAPSAYLSGGAYAGQDSVFFQMNAEDSLQPLGDLGLIYQTFNPRLYIERAVAAGDVIVASLLIKFERLLL